MIIVLVLLSLWWMSVVVQDLPDHMSNYQQVCIVDYVYVYCNTTHA